MDEDIVITCAHPPADLVESRDGGRVICAQCSQDWRLQVLIEKQIAIVGYDGQCTAEELVTTAREALARSGTAGAIAEHIAAIMALAPPLTATQRNQLATLLRPTPPLGTSGRSARRSR